jgi:hypothetical protein
MRLERSGVLFAALAVGVTAGAVYPQDKQPPADKKDPQSSYEPRSAPGVGQKFFEKFAGDWEVEKAFHPRGGGEPARSKGECKQEMIHDGRFLRSEFVFGSGAAKTTGTGLIGFEPVTGKFTSVWTDSRQTRMSFRQGRDKFDGEQIVLYGQSLGGEKDGRQSKTVTRLEDGGNKIVHRQYAIEADGQERLVMELVMTRKPARAR